MGITLSLFIGLAIDAKKELPCEARCYWLPGRAFLVF